MYVTLEKNDNLFAVVIPKGKACVETNPCSITTEMLILTA